MATAPTVSQIAPADFDWASSAGVAEGVRRTVAAAASTDRSRPLDEAALLSLQHGGLTRSTLWVAEVPGAADNFAGFALADATQGSLTDLTDLTDRSVEVNLVVAPAARRQGVAHALAASVLDAFPGMGISAWSHGDHPGAAALATALGFDRVRDLWVMRRPLDDTLPEVTVPGSLVVRPFEPGRDEQAFLEVNAAAFAEHPEQGEITRADLDQRMAQDWFDPAGFFLARSTTPGEHGRLLGYHWTKVHRGDPSYGEVYVVGVSPSAQGLGLGRLLTLIGLHHLRSLGLGAVILYVESDNDAAVALYRRLGFTHADEDTHVMYAGSSPEGAAAQTLSASRP